MIPELPELPAFLSVAVPRLPDLSSVMDPSLPGKKLVRDSGGRAEEAAQMANDMRVAFAYSKAANKRSKAVAKAKGRQAQRIAESR